MSQDMNQLTVACHDLELLTIIVERIELCLALSVCDEFRSAMSC
jgi:hypothetical protein